MIRANLVETKTASGIFPEAVQVFSGFTGK